MDSLDAALARIHSAPPEWVVYCGRAASSSWDEEQPEEGDDDLARVDRITRTAVDVQANLLLISADSIFDGPSIFHDESEAPSLNPGSQQLHAVEQAALRVADRVRVLIARTNSIGWSRNGGSFAERLWQSLEEGRPVAVDGTSYATPILATDAADLLLRCCRSQLKGAVHVAGAERTSAYRFAQELASMAGFDRRLVQSRMDSTASGDGVIALARERSLASRVVRRELGVALPLLRETVGKFIQQATGGWRDQLRDTSDTRLLAA
jgi:dTDP-4-dehydrorhamnose reductase